MAGPRAFVAVWLSLQFCIVDSGYDYDARRPKPRAISLIVEIRDQPLFVDATVASDKMVAGIDDHDHEVERFVAAWGRRFVAFVEDWSPSS